MPRALPKGLGAVVEKAAIRTLPIFEIMRKHVSESEMFRTFNMGVGMIWVVSKDNADSVAQNVGGYVIGELVAGEREARLG